MIILSIDASLNNLGLALMRYGDNSGDLSVLELSLVRTENEAGKQVRKSSDDLRRARELRDALHRLQARADLCCAEVPSGAQSARAAMSNGIVIGVLAGITKPLIEVSPAEAKKAVLGKKTGSKEEMIAWATMEYPEAHWLRRKLKGELVPIDANEHLADACAIAHAAVRTDAFKAALAMRGAMSRMAA